jgi:hypothetical protein
MSRSTVLTGVLAVALACAGCAASKASSPPASEPASAQGYGQAGYPSGGAAPEVSKAPPYSQTPQPPPPPPAPPPGEAAPATPSASSTPAQPNGGAGGTATSRSLAIQSAAREVESSQRELDVAGSDCRNACRALGSMDRAAGRLCTLSQGDGEPQRCDDAKRRVYSARDRVKTTCGTCADGTTVDRAAPIPSR